MCFGDVCDQPTTEVREATFRSRVKRLPISVGSTMIRRGSSEKLPPRKQRCVLQPMSPDSVPSEISSSENDTSQRRMDGFDFFVDNDNKFLDAIEDLILGPNEEREGCGSLASPSSRRSNASDYCERIATVRERRTGSRTPSPSKLPPRPLRKTKNFGAMQDKTQRVNNVKLENKSSSDLDDMLVGLAIPVEQMSPPKGQWRMLPKTTKKQHSHAALLKSISSESEVLEFDSAFDFDDQQFPEQEIPHETRNHIEDENREQISPHNHLETIQTPTLHTSSTEEFEIVFHDDTDEPDFPDIKGSLWGNQALWEWGSQSENTPRMIEPKTDKWAQISPISEDTRSHVHSVPSSPFDTPRPNMDRRKANGLHRATTNIPTKEDESKEGPKSQVEDSIEVPFPISPSIFDSRDSFLPLEEAPTELGGGCFSPIYIVSPTRLRKRPDESDKANITVVSTTEGVELERSRTFLPKQLPSIHENEDGDESSTSTQKQLARSTQNRAAKGPQGPQIDTGVSHVSVDRQIPETDDGSVKKLISSSSQSKASGLSSRNGSNRSLGLKKPPVFFRLEQYARMKSEEEKKAPTSTKSLLSPSLKWAQRKSQTARNLASKWKSPNFQSRQQRARSTGGTLQMGRKNSKLERSNLPSNRKDQRCQDKSQKKASLQQVTQVQIKQLRESDTNTGAVEEDGKNPRASKSQVSVSSVEVETVLTPIPEQGSCQDDTEPGDGSASVMKSSLRNSQENDKPVILPEGEGIECDETKATATATAMPKILSKRDGEVSHSANNSPPKVSLESNPRKGLNSSIFSSPALRKVLDLEACPKNLRRLHQRNQQFQAKRVTKESSEETSRNEQHRAKTRPTSLPQSMHLPNTKPITDSNRHPSLGFKKTERPHSILRKAPQEPNTADKRRHARESVSQVVDAVEVQLPRTKIPSVSKTRVGRSSSSPAGVQEMMKVVSSTRRANRKPKTPTTATDTKATQEIHIQSGHPSVSKKYKSEHGVDESGARHRKLSEKQGRNTHPLKSEPEHRQWRSPAKSIEDNTTRKSVASPVSHGAKDKESPRRTVRVPSSSKISTARTESRCSTLPEALYSKTSDVSRSEKTKARSSPRASAGAGSLSNSEAAQSPGKHTRRGSPDNLMKRRQGKQQKVACPETEDKSIQDEPCLSVSDEARRIVLMNSTMSSSPDDDSVVEPGKGIDPISSFLKLQEIRSAFVQGKIKTPSNAQVRKIRQAYNTARRAKDCAQKFVEDESPALSMISLVSSASTLSAAEKKITERLAADVQMLTEIKKRKKELSSTIVETRQKPESTKSFKTPHSKVRLSKRPDSARVLHALSTPKPEPAAASTKSANFSVYKMAKWMPPSSRRVRSSIYS